MKRPLLLLIPGMLNTAEVWSDVAAALRDDAELRVADVQTQVSIADMARDAWALVGDVADDRPLVVGGFSMGGYVAMEMLARAERRVDALALVDTSARTDTEAARQRRAATAAALAGNFERAVRDTAAATTHPATQQEMPALMTRLVAMMGRVGSDTAVRQVKAIMGRADHRAVLADLSIPVLVACGEGDRVTPPEAAAELAALIPGARLESIAQAGHMAPLEQPQRVAELLRGLLNDAQRRLLDQTTTETR